MASTYVNDLRLNEMATGDGSGTWGTTTNTNLELIAEAFSYGTEVITTNADTHTTTIADGSTDPGRSLYLKYTGTLDSACTITIGPDTVSKVWIIENGTSGSQDIIISQGSGANITIPAGDTKVVYSDGAGAGAAFVDAFASLNVVDLKVQDDLTVTGDVGIGTSSPATKLQVNFGDAGGNLVNLVGDGATAGTAIATNWNTGNAYFDIRLGGTTDTYTVMRVQNGGNVGIGTASPLAKNHITGSGTSGQVTASWMLQNTSSGTAGMDITGTAGASRLRFVYGGGPGTGTNSLTEAMCMGTEGTYAGNVGIGTSSPRVRFQVTPASNAGPPSLGTANAGSVFTSSNGLYGLNLGVDPAGVTWMQGMRFDGSATAYDMALQASGGNVGIGTASPTTAKLVVNGSGPSNSIMTNTAASIGSANSCYIGDDGTDVLIGVGNSGTNLSFLSRVAGVYTKTMTLNSAGNLAVAGALSKGSGSFKIDHPLPAKTDTHHLIHSFIEGPQADLIYRGKVDLVAGSATANIDTVAGMTEGTFVTLNREVQCFTTNESNWDAVKGSVSGNILTIESENSESTATISWLVIGERQDQHMYDTDWTDENGKVIVEPIKS
jgi:hypothetical protein